MIRMAFEDIFLITHDENRHFFNSEILAGHPLHISLGDRSNFGSKIVEIIGEDNAGDLDPETIYFLNKFLNELNLKKIRNNILSEVLPVRV